MHTCVPYLVSVVFMSDGFGSLPISVCSFLVMPSGLVSIPVSVRHCSRDIVLSTLMCDVFCVHGFHVGRLQTVANLRMLILCHAMGSSGLVGGFHSGETVHPCGLSCGVCARIRRILLLGVSVGVGFNGDKSQTLVHHRKFRLREYVSASVHDVFSGLRCHLVIGFGTVVSNGPGCRVSVIVGVEIGSLDHGQSFRLHTTQQLYCRSLSLFLSVLQLVLTQQAQCVRVQVQHSFSYSIASGSLSVSCAFVDSSAVFLLKRFVLLPRSYTLESIHRCSRSHSTVVSLCFPFCVF